MRRSRVGGNRQSSGGIPTATSRRSSSAVAPLRTRNDNVVNTQHQSRLSSSSRLSFGRSASCGKSPSHRIGMPSSNNRLSRGSSVGLRGPNCVPKDPRPVSDKMFQSTSIRRLVEFLSERRYPHNISYKLLQSPTSKDFFRIFEFLYGFLAPKFTFTSKPEEQIPKLFKQLGYPFMISKSQMFALGSPHTWPHMLAAVVWLLDLIQAGEEMSNCIDGIMFPRDDDFDSKPEKMIEFDYIESTYVAYMKGRDTFEEYDEKLADVLNQKYYGISGGMENIEKENKRLLQEIEILEQDNDKLQSLQEKEKSMTDDIQRFESYLNELELHKQNQMIILKEAEYSLTNTAAEHDECLHQLKKMQNIHEIQEFSAADIDRIKASGMELRRQIDEMERRSASVDQEIWTVEMKLSKEREKFEQCLTQYHKTAQVLKLIPRSSENSIDYQISSIDTKTCDKLQNVIKPALNQLHKQCQESIIKKTSEKIAKLDSLEQLSEYVTECQDEADQAEKRIKLIDEEISIKKQNYQQEVNTKNQEVENLEREIMEMQRGWKGDVSDAKKDLMEKNQWAEKKRREIRKEESEYIEFLRNVIQEVIQHKEKIEEKLTEMFKEAQEYRKNTEEECAKELTEQRKMIDQLQQRRKEQTCKKKL